MNTSAAGPRRPIAIANRHPRLRIDGKAIRRVVHLLDAAAPSFVRRGSALDRSPAGELSLVFLDDEALAQLHARFMDDPSVTDVITFEGDGAHGTAGEICVSADAAARHAGLPLASSAGPAHRRQPGQQQRSPGNSTPALQQHFSRELTLYVVHGWLHLAGYDDLIPAKKRVMRRAEARAITLLQREQCLPQFGFQVAMRQAGVSGWSFE